MLTTIKLHGFIGQKYGREAKLAGENWFQLMSGLVHRFGVGFKEDIRVNSWHLIKGKRKSGNDIGTDELQQSVREKELHLVPAIVGQSGALRVVLGVALIAASFIPGLQAAAPYLMSTGVSMVLGGVVEILAKPKQASPDQARDDKGSDIYNGAVNVTSQGGPIPLLYGRVRRASSVLISTDFSSDEVA